MKLIFLGPPGAGKGTISDLAVDKLGLPHISTGDLFRAAVKNGTPLGLKVKDIMASGGLVPDELTIELVKERLSQKDTAVGWILDGFPRTIPQAEALDQMLAERGQKIDLVLELKVNDAMLLSRVEARIKAGGVLRSDDTPETLAYRLGVYYKNTAPLIDFYRGQGKLRTVDGMAPVEVVTAEIATVLDGLRPD